jgi:hypothetical protein
MSLKTKYYFGMPGATGFFDPALSNTTIYSVTRSGTVYSVITVGEAANIQVLYLASGGGIFFDPNIPFIGPAPDLPISINDLEKISVKYRE